MRHTANRDCFWVKVVSNEVSSQGWLGIRSLSTLGSQRAQLWAARLAVYAVTTLMLHELISLAAGRQQQA